MPALELDNVRKVYGTDDQQVVALDDVSLTVGSDEMMILVGPSGSGKTTLLTVAGALLRPTSGSRARRRSRHHRPRRQGTGRVPARRGRLRLPVGQPDPVPHRQGEPARRPPVRRFPRRRRGQEAGRPAARRARPRWTGRQPAVPAVGRSEAAGGHRPGADERPLAGAGRRTDLSARLRAGQAGDGPAPTRDQGPWRGSHHRHPRRPGPGVRRPHRAASSTVPCKRPTPARPAAERCHTAFLRSGHLGAGAPSCQTSRKHRS